jgi:hypothetical protein
VVTTRTGSVTVFEHSVSISVGVTGVADEIGVQNLLAGVEDLSAVVALVAPGIRIGIGLAGVSLTRASIDRIHNVVAVIVELFHRTGAGIDRAAVGFDSG